MSGDDGADSERAFSALGHEIRLEILNVLADAAESGEPALTFSAVYDRVDIDSTSQLSYHLDPLVGLFVRDTEDGYGLTQAGDRVVRAIRSGMYADRPSFEPTTLDGRCPYCDATVLTAAYRESALAVECDTCGGRVVTFDLSPAESRERTSIETLHSCNRRAHHEYATSLQGTCPTCGGSTDIDIESNDTPDSYSCVSTCRHCGLRLFAPLEVRLLHHPAVVSFYWAHGIDAATLPLWDLPQFVREWEVDALATDPYEFRVTVVHEGESIQLTVDADLQVAVVSEGSSGSAA